MFIISSVLYRVSQLLLSMIPRTSWSRSRIPLGSLHSFRPFKASRLASVADCAHVSHGPALRPTYDLAHSLFVCSFQTAFVFDCYFGSLVLICVDSFQRGLFLALQNRLYGLRYKEKEHFTQEDRYQDQDTDAPILPRISNPNLHKQKQDQFRFSTPLFYGPNLTRARLQLSSFINL